CFFFQAEDGIRDRNVTGVQTCALPILPKDAAFWQFLYIIFCKMHDESVMRARKERRFWAGPTEQFDPEGQKQIRMRIDSLFDEEIGRASCRERVLTAEVGG